MSNDTQAGETYQVLQHQGQGWTALEQQRLSAGKPPGGPRTVRVARWSAQHPWRAIAAWVIFVTLCVVGGGAAGTKTDRGRQQPADRLRSGRPHRDQRSASPTTPRRTSSSPPDPARSTVRRRRPPRRRSPPGCGPSPRSRPSTPRSSPPTARHCSCRSRWPATPTPPRTGSSTLQAVTAKVAAEHPDAAGRGGRRRLARQGAQRHHRR